MFVYGNELILIGRVLSIVLAVMTATFGVEMLAEAVQGSCIGSGKMNHPERTCLLAASLLLMKPGWMTDVVGIGIEMVLYLWKWRVSRAIAQSPG
jgi:TRAP-type uncharacterized transport system fused permease subunit